MDPRSPTAGSDVTDRLEADLGFPLLLCELADNPMLVQSWKRLEGRIRVGIMSHDAAELPGIMSHDRHALIVEAIRAGDAPAARAVLEEHLAGTAEVYASSWSALSPCPAELDQQHVERAGRR